MNGMQVSEQQGERLGREWIQAILEKDFERIGILSQPVVRSRLMTPRRTDVYENADDLIRKVAGWFQECSSFHIEQSRIAMVGEKLAIFYRLSLEDNGQSYVVEQQLYCSLRDSLIDQLSLLCSGFQPVQDLMAAQPPHGLASFQADARLQFTASDGLESTCAILTPSIKRKLNEMSPGQILEVQVDDPSVQEDIEAWCRLSGNTLLKMDVDASQGFHFYLMKK